MSTPIWLTDRSRYTAGTGRCRMQRFLTNHYGPTGYGMVRKAESLPLATGKYTHLALEGLFRHLRDTDTFPEVAQIRAAIAEAVTAYDQRIAARGYAGLLQSERSDQVIVEQKALVAGLVWAFSRTILPWIYRDFRIVETETEQLYVLGCTCGAGALAPQAEHEARDCTGIGQMLKLDVLAEPRVGEGLIYFETKTTGWAGDTWSEQWETKPQLAIGSFGIEERYGKKLTGSYIIGLQKGPRKKAVDAFGEEITRQESVLCYGYCRPGNPPLAPEDWVPSYEWTDEQGQVRRKSRQHEKRGIWEIEHGDWPVWLASKQADPTLTPTECWVNWLPQPVLAKQVFLVGPMQPQVSQIASLKRAIVAEERDWQARLWQLYEWASEHGAHWTDAAYQAQLDALFPRSYDCRRFGSRHQCEFVPICFKLEGWDDPLGGGKYVPRRPHHEPELRQAIERGLLPEQSEEEEQDEE